MSRVLFYLEKVYRLMGIDAVYESMSVLYESMSVRPTAHYYMGGIPVNTQVRVCLSGT
jgi:succinate dehydrogenase / fumarate reductase, flavoprotein subunit